jgi:Holliday junction resolvase RusA-like endonuclease
MITLELYGDPIAWTRPQRNNRTGAIYDGQKKEKEQCRWQMKAMFAEEPLTCPCEIDVTFFFPVPKSANGVQRREMLNGVLHHIKRPDVDNCAKFVLDAMTGVVLSDDCIVWSMTCRKLYSEKPRTVIQIIPFTNNLKRQNKISDLYDNDPGEC